MFLGSGLLFVAMLFAGGRLRRRADRGGGSGSAAAPGPDTLARRPPDHLLLLHVYAMRMAAVFTMSAATIMLRTKVGPEVDRDARIAVGVVLLVSVGLTPWVELLFPAWILLLSVDYPADTDCSSLLALPGRPAARRRDRVGRRLPSERSVRSHAAARP